MTLECLPNFLVIGAAKSGTTSLHRYLGQHPDVFMTRRKEPRFFAFANERVSFRGPDTGRLSGLSTEAIEHEKYSYSVTELDDYRALFRSGRRSVARGESSTAYLYLPKAIHRINYYVPRARLVAILRNPVDRAYSKYCQLRRDHAEPIARFRDALSVEQRRIAAGWAPAWHYRQRGFYYAQLSRICDAVDRGRIFVCTFDEFTTDARSTLRDIYAFLDVDDSFVPDVSERHNVSMSEGPQPEHGGLDAELRFELAADYRIDILKLEALIERDLSNWLN